MFKISAVNRLTTILLLAFILTVSTGCGDGQKKAKVLKTVPAFSLTSLEGTTITKENLGHLVPSLPGRHPSPG